MMLIGYSMPATTISLPGTATWLTDDDGDACVDGIPTRRARMLWRTDAVPAIAHYVTPVLTFAAAAQIRIFAVLGLLNVPVGAVVAIWGKRSGDTGWPYDFGGGNTGTVVQFADGTRGVWFVLPAAASPVLQIELRLYNNVAGATWATLATQIDIGEVVAMQAVDIELASDWSDELVDPTEVNLTRDSQPRSVARLPYRRIEGGLTVDGRAAVRGGALGGSDWAQLRFAMSGDRRVIAIPRWRSSAGVVDQAEVNATALYGTGRFGKVQHAGGDYYSASIAFLESPAGI